MQNLRIVSVQVTSSTSIDITFTAPLTSNLLTANVSIISDTINVPTPEVLQIKISDNTLSVTCQPLTPFASYYIKFQSIPNHPFTSLHGDAIVLEDGVSNQYLFSGPLESDNPVKNYLTSFFHNNIYNTEDPNTVVSSYLQSLAVNFSKALYDIKQSVNENYLSFTVVDEQKTRGDGPFDRLNEESAYDIIRVGRGPSSANASTSFVFATFPSAPVTLQKRSVVETLTIDSSNILGKFNINDLILNLQTNPVTKVNSIIFTLATATPIYTYDISTLGYQIQNSKYDPDFGSTYYALADNQIKLSEKILSDPNFSLNSIIRVDVEYESKDLGRVVKPDTISVYTILTSIREVLPPVTNIFSLKFAPIVNSNNEIPLVGGVSFYDPNNPGTNHPAFVQEIPFRLNSLPSMPGQYSIDYSTSTVYVFGNDLTNNGTGPYPPVATYQYRYVYQSELDYVYDSDLLDLVALPNGNLVEFDGTILFNYEEVLIPGVDYTSELHVESLEERVENRLVAVNALRVKKSPITNVFRVYNETSGEIYTVNRWNDDKIYFRYNNPPRISSQINERASFDNNTNELLFVDSTITNIHGLRIFKIPLKNNTIISSTEDCIASSINTSLIFSNSLVFKKEKWWNRLATETNNTNILSNIGEYCVDYINGVVYCAVSTNQLPDIGSASYKINDIAPTFSHLISVDDIYYRISPLLNKNKQLSYLSFGDGSIVIDGLENSDELFLGGDQLSPYQIYGGKIGAFSGTTFLPGVTEQVKFVRGVFEYTDLTNSTNPINFANVSTANGFAITVGNIVKQEYAQVHFDGTNYYVLVNENIPYLSSNISYTFSIVRNVDGKQLWDNAGAIVAGDPVKLVLSGINTPTEGDAVIITYTFAINDLARVVVDYNKGDLFIDYTYLADELLVSYEYGDNVIDFRKNKNLPTNSTYYVSYKVGALRDTLVKNFGNLVNISELSSIDVDFDRERYRDALTAALGSFIQGPTLTAIKNIGKTISHIEPDVVESAFQDWILGTSLLTPESIITSGEFQLLPAKFGNGVLVDSPSQTIKFPTNSNLRFEEGTFEEWIIPQWNGIDNDATLTFNILKDGYAIDPLLVFIGTASDHPSNSLSFTVNKNDINSGTPNTNKDGVFIYYDKDTSGNFYRWYVRVVDGYVSPSSGTYKIKITSNGSFYDNKSIIQPAPLNLSTFTGTNSITLNLVGGTAFNEGITFVSDYDHYLLDFGKDSTHSRLSIFKDISGYINFRVYDKFGNSYYISTDVSSWKAGDTHFVAASWKINGKDGRDELHLFIDGKEVPNIIKFGQKLRPYLHEKFRTVDPEEIVGSTNRDIVASIDLVTTIGSNLVSSSIDFSAYNIQAGDTIYIDEVGFSSFGYTISAVNGQTLTLNTPMPLSMTNVRFSVNRVSFVVLSDIDIAPNIEVTTIHSVVSAADLVCTSGSNMVYSPSINFSTSNISPGFSIRINNSSLEKLYTIVNVLGHYLILSDSLTLSLSNATFNIYSNQENELPGLRALRPDYSISKDNNFNNVLTLSNGVKADDLVLVRTLGLGFRRVKKDYYIWSDYVENVLMTRLPAPISLDEVNINKIILPTIGIGQANSTLIGGVYHSSPLTTYQPIVSQNGRTISVTISGNNVDFSVPVQVTINGVTGVYTVSETISFTDYGTLDFANPYVTINNISVIAAPLNVSKNAVSVSVKEKYSITHSEHSGIVPVIRFSYPIQHGYALYTDGFNSVRDDSKQFSQLDVGGYLVVNSPAPVAGFYRINAVSNDRHSLQISSTSTSPPLPLPLFTGGVYQVLHTTDYRSGLQNGFFTFEVANMPGQEYLLNKGFYQLDYNTYLNIGMEPTNSYCYLGSDFNGKHQVKAIIDHAQIYSTMLTDTRIGEVTLSNQRSITKNYNSLKPIKKDRNTLLLTSFDSFPFENIADYYVHNNQFKKYFLSSFSVNSYFANSIQLLDKPIILSNDGILDTKKEGTIEFWLSPMFDTANDPNDRFYFDAYGAVVEEAVSVNNVSVKLSSPASRIVSVKLKGGDPNIDYFAGGSIEIDTQNAIVEDGNSTSNTTVNVSHPILQVISVKIAGDLSGQDYFASGSISSDKKTIYLGKSLPTNSEPLIITYQSTDNNNKKLNTQVIRLNRKLPSQKSHLVITYLPKGINGDRVSIFKDNFGYVNFSIIASGNEFVVRGPTRWAKGTWHRVKASYRVNAGVGNDDMKLFLDGYEYSNTVFGSGSLVGAFPVVSGSTTIGTTDGYAFGNIQFKDSINEIVIGAQFDGQSPIFTLIDNLRISNIFRPIYAPYGEPIDVNYNGNLSTVFPVTTDLYTTYLMDFGDTIYKNTDFTTLKNRSTGNFDFSINIFDSFGIVSSSPKVQQILEKLIKVLKPAASRVFISYTK